MAKQMDAETMRNTEPNARMSEYRGRIVGRLFPTGLAGSVVVSMLCARPLCFETYRLEAVNVQKK
jgi:hypothetical protein